MTDQATPTAITATADKADIVQRFLFALEVNDFDTFEELAAPGLVWQNVGLPSLRGRSTILKALRRGEGKFGFGVKFHRIAAEGDTVLT